MKKIILILLAFISLSAKAEVITLNTRNLKNNQLFIDDAGKYRYIHGKDIYKEGCADIFSEEVRKKCIGDEPVMTARPADFLEPEMEKFRQEIKQYIRQDEDVLSYALFPQVAMRFFEARETGEDIREVPPAKAKAAQENVVSGDIKYVIDFKRI